MCEKSERGFSENLMRFIERKISRDPESNEKHQGFFIETSRVFTCDTFVFKKWHRNIFMSHLHSFHLNKSLTDVNVTRRAFKSNQSGVHILQTLSFQHLRYVLLLLHLQSEDVYEWRFLHFPWDFDGYVRILTLFKDM